MRRWLVALAVVAFGLSGAAAAFALTGAETTGTVTAAVPDQTITIPGSTNVQTYTIPTVTETVTTTVTTTTAPPPPPPPPPPAEAPFIYAPLDGSIDTSKWNFQAASGYTAAWLTDGQKNGAVRYHTPASSTWSSGSGRLISHFLDNGSSFAGTSEGQTTWYREAVRTPANSFIPGEWDWLVEWHNNTGIVPGSVSSAWGLVSSGSISGPSSGTSPYLEFRASGGPNTAPVYTRYRMAPGSFTAGTWHDLVAEITWGPNASTGALSLWVDGQSFPSYSWPQHIPTLLYNSATGQRDDPAFGIYNYHYAVTYPVDRDYDELLAGPTAASVGFFPF